MATANSGLQITNLDFGGIKTSLKSFLSQQDTLKDYNFDGSALSVLVDLLAYNALNELDRQNASLLSDELDIPVLPGYAANKSLGLLYYFNDDASKVTLYKAGTHNATATFDTSRSATYTLIQDGQTIIQNVNKGSTSIVTITQN
jgi:hypothetical protein